MPINVVIQLSASRIVEAINRFEPRVTVHEVDVVSDPLKGKVMPKVKVTINAESI